VIDASSVENQSIASKTDDTMTNSIESFSTINDQPISEDESSSPANSNSGKILPIIASIKLPSGKTITGSCVQNAVGKVTVNFPREETGSYTVTLKHKKSGKIIAGSPYEVVVQAKEVKTTMTAYGTGLKEAGLDTTNCFTVFGSKGIEVNDVCILAFGPHPCQLKVFQNEWDSIDILYEVKRSGSYHFYVHENGKDIPGSPFHVLAKSHQMNSKQLFSSYVASVWRGQSFKETRALTSMRSPNGQAASHTVARKGKHLLEVRFLPSLNGCYELDIFKDVDQLEQTFNIKVDALPVTKDGAFLISGEGLHTAFINKPAVIFINSAIPSLKSFSVEFDGPGVVDIVQKRSAKTSNAGCSIEYVGQMPGRYRMSIKYDGFHVEGSPFNVDIFPAHGMITDPSYSTEQLKQQQQKKLPTSITTTSNKSDVNACIASGDGLKQAFLDKMNFFHVNTSEAGDGILMAGFHSSSTTATEVNCKHLGSSSYEVQYKIGQTGLHRLSVFWNGQNIPGSPFEINVLDENNNSSSC